VAAVILEPVVGNSGFIAPDKAFLEGEGGREGGREGGVFV